MQSYIDDLTLEITNRCNLFCKQCDIWKERPFFDLSIVDIKKIISVCKRPIKNVSLTGGEIFTHPNFDDIFKFLLSLRAMKSIRGLNLVSNGYDFDTIVNILSKHKTHGAHFDMDFSVDGKSKEHNFQRGAKDAFSKTVKTMLWVRSNFPSMKVSLKFTINNRNYKDLIGIYEFCRRYKFHFYPKLVESGTSNYYHRLGGANVQMISSFDDVHGEIITALEQLQIVEDANHGGTIESHIIPLLIKELKGKFIVESCATPEKSLFLSSRGDVFSCLYYDKISNIHKEGWEEGLESDYQKKIIKEGACGDCPGCMAYHGYLKHYNLQ